MYSQAVATETRKASRLRAQVDVPPVPAGAWGAATSHGLNYADPLPSNGADRAERDRRASLEFLHRLVIGEEGD